MSIDHNKHIFRSLRFRLMVWNAFVVVIAGVVTLIGVRVGVRFTLVRELDSLLKEDMREIQLSLTEYRDHATTALREQLDRKSAGHAQHQWFAHLYDAQGKLIYSSSNAPSEEAFSSHRLDHAPRTVGGWRIYSKRIENSPTATVCIGASLEMINRDIARLDRHMVIAICVILLVAPMGGYWLAGRATRPLADIINRIAKLRPSNLEERLPIRGTGDELDRLSITFNHLLDHIGVYLNERRDFLANAAHELRTPLAAIRSSVEVALAGDRTSAEYEELLNEIIEESASLELMVNQLLLIAETETERLKIRKENVRLDDILEKAMDMFGGVAEFHNIRLLCPALPPIEVEGNRQHLRQVVYNLLDNALKFTPTGGQVRLLLSKEESAGEARLQVQDTGVGIPAEDLPHIFNRFFRGRSMPGRGDRAQGAGLGLSICRAIVLAHEGSITVESTLGKGTTFVVRLPLFHTFEGASSSEVRTPVFGDATHARDVDSARRQDTQFSQWPAQEPTP